MSAVIETIVLCDECGEQCGGDDRYKPAWKIRLDRKSDGWTQMGKKDFCGNCSKKKFKITVDNRQSPP
jgi:hypothetical protein